MYASRSLSDTEKKYDTYEKEALAIIFCVTHFCPYLYGKNFALVTDHKPLVWFESSEDPCSLVSRWKLKLTEYDFDAVCKAGIMIVNTDALSINPIFNEENSRNLQEDDDDDDTFMTSQEKINFEKTFMKINQENNIKKAILRKINIVIQYSPKMMQMSLLKLQKYQYPMLT